MIKQICVWDGMQKICNFFCTTSFENCSRWSLFENIHILFIVLQQNEKMQGVTQFPVISLEIRPLAALSHPHPYKKVFYRALRGRRGLCTHAYGICTPFCCISLKNTYGGGGGITLPGVWFQGTLPNFLVFGRKKIAAINTKIYHLETFLYHSLHNSGDINLNPHNYYLCLLFS